MLQAESLRYNRPDGAGLCAEGDSGQWTGEKRRKHLGPSLPSDTSEVADARISSSCSSDGPGGQEEPKHTIFKAPWEKEELDSIGHVSDEEFLRCKDLLSKRPKPRGTRCGLDLEAQRQVYERLLMYRIRARKLSKGESKDKLSDEALRKELPAFLQQDVSLRELDSHVVHYFLSLVREEGDTFDWYFAYEYSKFGELDDYQRLVLGDRIIGVGYEYLNWEYYHSKFTTYEMDKEYVKCFEAMSCKLKWLKHYVGYPQTSDEWSKMYSRGVRQALLIVSEFPHMTSALAYSAYEEHIWSLRFDYLFREDMDRLFFEIWKRVTATRQTTFAVALEQVLRENLVPRHEGYMQRTLKKDSFSDLEEQYNSCVEGIPGNASEEVAKGFIIEAVWKRHKPKMLHQYMARKMEIAESIGLVK